jgi:FkbM family methyltransferase
MLSRTENAIGFRGRIQSLCYLTIHYSIRSGRFLRPCFQYFHDLVALREGDMVLYPCRVAGSEAVFLLRSGNLGDYCVAGELTDGIYSAPDFTPDQIVDCGANIGAFSLFAGKKYPHAKLTCFEPDEENLRVLKLNLLRNGIAAEIRECGVWSKSGMLYYHPASSITGLVSEEKSDFPIPVQKVVVESQMSWVKLDVEGAEYEVIPDLLKRTPKPKFLSIELHFFNKKGRPIVEMLNEHGYRLKGYIDDQLECVVFDAGLRN